MSLSHIEFPNAAYGGYTKTSPSSQFYNCIAWAAGDTSKFWWPGSIYSYWPENVPARTTIYAFLRLFRTLGYETCRDGDLEHGYEKIAIYAIGTEVRHAARQLQNGNWTSKLGTYIDVEHATLEILEGPKYGRVVRFLKRL